MRPMVGRMPSLRMEPCPFRPSRAAQHAFAAPQDAATGMRAFSPYPLVRGELLFFIGEKQRFLAKRGDLSPFFDRSDTLLCPSRWDALRCFAMCCMSDPMKKLQCASFYASIVPGKIFRSMSAKVPCFRARRGKQNFSWLPEADEWRLFR